MSATPLAGRRIVVTRTREQSSALAEGLRRLGAEVIEAPTIRIMPPDSYTTLDAALARLHEYDVLLVTSANSVRVIRERLKASTPQLPWTLAVGPATSTALRDAGLRVDAQPLEAVAEAIVQLLAPQASGKRMLLVRAAVGRDLLPEMLREAGAMVDVAPAYRTVPDDQSRLRLTAVFVPGAETVDAVTFTSSSTVQSFFALLGEEAASRALAQTLACSIGPVTSSTLRELGIEPAVEAATHDVPGLIAAIRSAFF